MKTAIIYYSKHHGNTKKLLDAIATKHDVTLIDALNPTTTDLSDYDLIGFASGIYYSKFHKSVAEYAQKHLPNGKKVFFLYTCATLKNSYTNDMKEALKDKNATIVGTHHAFGYNTFGPFKLIGGIKKGHPTLEETQEAVSFYEKLIQ